MNQHDFNTALIDFVREEDVLYTQNNLNYTNSGERHLAYERIAAKLREHGASYEQTHRLNEKFLKLKWRWMKERTIVEEGKRAPSWPYYQSLSYLLPSVLDKRMNASVPEDGQSRDEQYVDVQTCDVPSGSGLAKGRSTQKRKAMNFIEDETDSRLMEKRRVTNIAFSEFVACKLDEMPEPIRSNTERQIIDLIMSVHVETFAELTHCSADNLTIGAEVYHPAGPEPTFENCHPVPPPTRNSRTRPVRKPKEVE